MTSNYFKTVLVIACLLSGLTAHAAADEFKGLGASQETPKGPPWVPPAGIKGAYKADYKCLAENLKKQKGSGFLVRVCVTFTNTHRPGAGPDIPVVIPRGTIFISETEGIQNGILVNTVKVSVPAGSTQSFLLNLYCLNRDRSPTDFNNNNYSPGPVTTNAKLQRLIEHQEELEIDGAFPGAGSKKINDMKDLQNKVWQITDPR